jgi:hypothetical protein
MPSKGASGYAEPAQEAGSEGLSDRQLEKIRAKIGEVRVAGTSIGAMVDELLSRRSGWIMLDITSPSGKPLWACLKCGHVDQAPSINHQCA